MCFLSIYESVFFWDVDICYWRSLFPSQGPPGGVRETSLWELMMWQQKQTRRRRREPKILHELSFNEGRGH